MPKTAPVPENAPGEIARRVVSYFRGHRRDLPWRRTRDPYALWVSEVMLQQTRVETVIPYYERWLERFPTVTALARAPLDDVLSAWSGLGYYRRARNLHRGAREVVNHHGGRLPDTAAALRELPGIGRYTAGAVSSMAFGRVEPVVDGNVARVLARVYAIEDDVKSSATARRLWELAGALVPADAPGDFNQGLMEIGATVCTPARPGCSECPLGDACRARRAGRERELPVAAARKRVADLPLLTTAAAWIERRGAVLLARRPPTGLFGGLWELPQAEGGARELRELLGGAARVVGAKPVTNHRQTLSHRRLRIEVWTAAARAGRGELADRLRTRYDRVAWHRIGRSQGRGLAAATVAIIERYREYDGWKRTRPPSTSSSRATRRSWKGSASSATTRPRTRTSAAPRGGRPRGSRS